MPQQWQTSLWSIILTEIFWKAIFISCTTSGSSFQNLIDLGGGSIKGILRQRKRRETWNISVKTISKREHSNINNRLWFSQIFKEKQLDIGRENPWTRLQLYAVKWDIDWSISDWASLCLRLNKWLSRTIIWDWSCKKEVEGHPAPPRHGGEPTRWVLLLGVRPWKQRLEHCLLFAVDNFLKWDLDLIVVKVPPQHQWKPDSDLQQASQAGFKTKWKQICTFILNRICTHFTMKIEIFVFLCFLQIFHLHFVPHSST